MDQVAAVVLVPEDVEGSIQVAVLAVAALQRQPHQISGSGGIMAEIVVALWQWRHPDRFNRHVIISNIDKLMAYAPLMKGQS